MPLVVISGLPASGKSTRATQLKEYLNERGKKVHLISENEAIIKAGFDKNTYFADSQKEKIVRSDMKSEAVRLLNKDDVVILDGGNYIKGYRYELFCATKAARTTQCTLFCGIQKEEAWKLNQSRAEKDSPAHSNAMCDAAYTRDIFDAVCMRFEEPHGNCRWDSPLFVVFPGDELCCEQIYSALFESKPLPPNLSTQNPPLNSTNYLFELDRLTQQIVSDILSARKVGIIGPLSVKGCETKVDVPIEMNAFQLNRLRRQFLNYSKSQQATTKNLDTIPKLFVQYLNSSSA